MKIELSVPITNDGKIKCVAYNNGQETVEWFTIEELTEALAKPGMRKFYAECNCLAQHAYMTYVAHDETCPARITG